ncbi:hypothetical protein GTQ43_28860 [Nostoc sp. KVJ3]|uniref:hypothetical protein n=1 Tax=Nostoc sp. KVJ3 TaxID=457945 RepID=UPI00223798B0|nr:hypothetical protein [Nostoc sp. KVJ3]MCW5317641.1 hypothetical protein [Nostoc sp. KVJ3]
MREYYHISSPKNCCRLYNFIDILFLNPNEAKAIWVFLKRVQFGDRNYSWELGIGLSLSTPHWLKAPLPLTTLSTDEGH